MSNCKNSEWDNGWPVQNHLELENSDLAVEAKEQQHDEEQDGPQGRQRHHGHSFGISYEGQTGTWGKTERGRGKGVETGVNISAWCRLWWHGNIMRGWTWWGWAGLCAPRKLSTGDTAWHKYSSTCLKSVVLNQESPDPVLESWTPAGFSVPTGRNCFLSPRWKLCLTGRTEVLAGLGLWGLDRLLHKCWV